MYPLEGIGPATAREIRIALTVDDAILFYPE